MSDIVEWLRGANEILPRWRRLIEAADEIERLRDEIEQLKMRVAEAEWANMAHEAADEANA